MESTNVSEMENEEEETVEELFLNSIKSSISEDLSFFPSDMSEVEDRPKMKLYKQGLYDPGTGEICAEYIAMSDSAVYAHQYYMYPSLKDPGICEALTKPENDRVYEEDGQELYLDLCKEMNLCPVRIFHRGLMENVINLRYYGVNPKSIRAMCLALACNKTVQRLDLTSNFLECRDASYHLGQVLGYRNALEELVLAGCRIGSDGMKNLAVFLHTRKMQLMDLSGNDIKDEGFAYLAEEIKHRAIIRRLNLSYNNLTSASALLLAEALANNNTIAHLDLSRNMFYKITGPTALFRRLGHSNVLVELNLSWTSLNLSVALSNLIRIPTLRMLILSHNKLSSPAARIIAQCLKLAQKLQILDLSCNPFTPADAFSIVTRMRDEAIKLKVLRMDHIVVDKEFADELREVKALKFRRNTKITHGDVIHDYTIPLCDLRTIIMKRLVKTSHRKRANKLDILMHLLELNKKQSILDPADLIRTLKLHDSPVNLEVIDELPNIFRGPKNEQGKKTINLNSMVEYIHRLWPEKQPPPTPPPTPPPLPTPPKPRLQKKSPTMKKKSVVGPKIKENAAPKKNQPVSLKNEEPVDPKKKVHTSSRNIIKTNIFKNREINDKNKEINITKQKGPVKKEKIVKKK